MDEFENELGKEMKKSVVDMVMDGIVSDIIEGKLGPGDKLPTEMDLCRQFDAGRNSVREAIKKLEANGVVYIKRADGTYVAETYNKKMLDPMLYSIILHKNSWQDFVQLRSVIDIGTLEVIITNAKPEDTYNEEHRILLKMEAELYEDNPSVEKLMELDMQFHGAIAARTNNPQVVTITEYITMLTRPSRRETISRVIEQGSRQEFMALHKQMLDIIEKREIEKVVHTVLDHYIYWNN
ncbi:MAG: GntR family transcriptional regulator [Lachnospiraceae bacterium]|nr:GntR family transcriptional regulator [Lachnospiraceae bacterium]